MGSRRSLISSLRPLSCAVGAAAIAVALTAVACASPTPTEVVESAPTENAFAPSNLNPTGGLAWSQYFPNVELITHLGERVRFYDDLLKDKVVLINFMYATCQDS